MIEQFQELLERWNATKTDRQKLQTIFLTAGLLVILAAGMMTFLNPSLGYAMLTFGLGLLAVFLINAVAWHLLSSMLLSQLKTRTRRTTKK
jgi:cell division protein FtsW (lipid II flippase)